MAPSPPSLHQITCAACKYLRRRCKPDCVFAPHFPPDYPESFVRIHNVYGSSRVASLLGHLPMDWRGATAHSLAWEAEMWNRYPLYGCIPVVSEEYMQIYELERDILRLKFEMLPCLPKVNVDHPVTDVGSQQYPQSAVNNGGLAVHVNFPIADVGGHQFQQSVINNGGVDRSITDVRSLQYLQPAMNNGGSAVNVNFPITDVRGHHYPQSAINNGGSAVNVNFPIMDVGGHHYPQSAINNSGSAVNVNFPITDVGGHHYPQSAINNGRSAVNVNRPITDGGSRQYSQSVIYNSGYNCPLSEGQALDFGQASYGPYGGYCEVQEAAMADVSEVNVNHPITDDGCHRYSQPAINNGGHRFSVSQGQVLDFGQARLLYRYHNGVPGVEEPATADANGGLTKVNHLIDFSEIEDESIVEQYFPVQDPPSMINNGYDTGFQGNGDVPPS